MSRVSKDEGYHPRRSRGDDPRLAQPRPFYYCRSCNRLVPNANMAFCDKHRAQRDRFMRRLRDAKAPVPKRLLDALEAAHATVATGWDEYNNAPQGSARATAAWEVLDAVIADLNVLTRQVSRIEPDVRVDDIEDDDHLIN